MNPKEDIPPGDAERPVAEVVEDTGVGLAAVAAPRSRPPPPVAAEGKAEAVEVP